ncbi:MAG TPA: amino acid adenylation domain-containing protein [Gammaproteobacteria bacterium]|nr:amino acid adenylation domain-containing protein [Gammaproteobacteria bacterium]
MIHALHDWVTLQARRRPEATAIVGNGQFLSYAELDTLSTQLARSLRLAGCQRGDRVCLLMPKSPLAIVAIVGIHKAGGIYVPLDPASPAGRLSKIINSCDSHCILVGGIGAVVLQELLRQEWFPSGLCIGWLDETLPDWGRQVAAFSLDEMRNQHASPLPAPDTELSHILFTSGSTGAPKGVMITHRGVIHFVEWAKRYFGIGSDDRLSGHPPLHFDLSFFDIFGAFAAGAELHLVPAEANLLPDRLAEWIRTSRVTQWLSVPSALHYMARFDAVRPGDFPELRRLLWCGEVLPTSSLMHWMKRLPHVRCTNLYGPAETTIASGYYTVSECPQHERMQIPIGSACGDGKLLVLDGNMSPVAAGETGELYVGGPGLSSGYWKDPERTRQVFVEDPRDPSGRLYRSGDLARLGEDGLVYFLGRADSQIRSRGYRIEPGEIEAALNALDILRESAVVAVPSNGFDGAVICCAYVIAGDIKPAPARLRAELEKTLPRYMIPSFWMEFDELPKNANGKIDRLRLQEILQPHAVTAA